MNFIYLDVSQSEATTVLSITANAVGIPPTTSNPGTVIRTTPKSAINNALAIISYLIIFMHSYELSSQSMALMLPLLAIHTMQLNLVSSQHERILYVSPSFGNDNNNGTSISTPFQTLEAVQSHIRDLLHQVEEYPITVNLMEGTYYLESGSLDFLPIDSGKSTENKITYRAYAGEVRGRI